jgi:hypothetical protein
MAHEINYWKKPNCDLTLDLNKLSNREPYSAEINERDGENGALNADYRAVEAIAIVSNLLGIASFKYGEHFVFKTKSLEGISFDFCDKSTKTVGEMVLQDYLKQQEKH